MRLADAFVMAQELLDLHRLVDWRVEFDQAKTRAGVCRPHRKVIGLSGALR